MTSSTNYQIVDIIISNIKEFLRNKNTWNELHFWVLDNEDNFTIKNPYSDLIDEFETIFLADDNDHPQFLASKNDIRKLLSKFVERQNLISLKGEEIIIRQIEEQIKQAEIERRERYIKKHIRKHSKKR